MDSSFCLPHCNCLSSLPLCVPWTTVNISKPNSSLRFSSLSSTGRSFRSSLVRNIPTPIICTGPDGAGNGFSRPATNNKGEDNTARGSVGVSLAMACVVGIINCSYTMRHKALAFPPIVSPWGTVTATTEAHRLMDQMDRGVGPSKIDEQLKKTFTENPEAAYQIQMELIRILLSRGIYHEACRYCEDLSKKEIFYSRNFRIDHKFHLYKGIVYAIQYKNDAKAKECFQKYIDILDASPIIEGKTSS